MKTLRMIESIISFISASPILGSLFYVTLVFAATALIMITRGYFPWIYYYMLQCIQYFIHSMLTLKTACIIVITTILLITLILSYQVAFPKIVKHPWPSVLEKNKTVVIAGSYNPPHNGHLAMIRYLASRYGVVHVVIGFNPNKIYDVSPEKRSQLLQLMIASSDFDDKTKVKVRVVSGYIWRYAISQKVNLLYRGIRSWASDGKEETNLHILNSWGPLVFGPLKFPLKTVFLEGDPMYKHISSTLVRNVCKYGSKDGLIGLVPSKVADEVLDAYNQSI